MVVKEKNNLSKINVSKVTKTVRGSIKKAIFYLGANLSYSFADELVGLDREGLLSYTKKHPGIRKLVEIDTKIRLCDDILDNELSKINPLPVLKMKAIISEFKRQTPEAKDVARLFELELEMLRSNFKMEKEIVEDKIREIVKVRPCDYFTIINLIIETYGTCLTKKDFEYSLCFYQEFQRLRDLLDDMLSIEEDILKGDYNHIVVAKRNDISYHFFDEIISTKFKIMEESMGKIREHPFKEIFIETINFWKTEYENLFKKLMLDYYIDFDEFKKSYFMIKQL